MQNETVFPATRQDLDDLKQTAVDATRDLGSTASVYTAKAKTQLTNLAAHTKSEATNHLNQVKGNLNEVVEAGLNHVSVRPLISLGAVLGFGILLGLVIRRSSKS